MRVTEVIRTSAGGGWIVDELRVLIQRGHEVQAVLPNGPGPLTARLRAIGVDVVAAAVDLESPAHSLRPRSLKRLRDQLLESSPDVLLYQLVQTALAVRLATVSSGVPRVHQVPGPLHLESAAIRPAERVLSRLDDHIICGSQFTYQAYRDLGVSPKKLVMIPFGVDTSKFFPRAGVGGKSREDLDIPDSAFVAVMVAFAYAPKRLAHQGRGIKGHEVLIDAWAEFSHRHPDSYLVFLCDGWGPGGDDYRRRIRHESEVSARAGSVRWVGGERDSKPYYALASISVAPSWSENHGAGLEAGAMGVPSIVSSAGGLPETVDGSSGWVFNKGDVGGLLERLEESYDEFVNGHLPARGAAARQLVEDRFDSHRCAARVADFLESVVKQGKRGTSEAM